VEIYTVNK